MQAFAKKTKESTIQRNIFYSFNTIHFFKVFISKIQQKHKGKQDSRNLKPEDLAEVGLTRASDKIGKTVKGRIV